MKSYEFIVESPETELAKKLPSLKKFDYDTIGDLMMTIAKKHNITGKKLHDLFVAKYKKIPDDWIKDKIKDKLKLNEYSSKDIIKPINISESKNQKDFKDNPIVQKFIDWCIKELKLKSKPEFEFSYDTEQAQSGHHTGRHTPHDGKIWVYVNNRNMVDILRTVAHELRHVQQGEQGKIKPGDSYPFSPIEKDADVWAGGIIKIFGKKHPQIFE